MRGRLKEAGTQEFVLPPSRREETWNAVYIYTEKVAVEKVKNKCPEEKEKRNGQRGDMAEGEALL